MFLLAFTSSMPLSLTIHPRVREASYHFVLISGFLEEHAEAVEGHRLLDGAPGDEFVGDLGGGHEPAFAGTGDVDFHHF